MKLTRDEALAILPTLTDAERAYNRRRASEILESGGTLSESIRIPIEEIAAAREAQGGAP